MLLICLSRNLWASGSKSLRGQIVTSVWYTAPEASELLPPAREVPEPPSPSWKSPAMSMSMPLAAPTASARGRFLEHVDLQEHEVGAVEVDSLGRPGDVLKERLSHCAALRAEQRRDAEPQCGESSGTHHVVGRPTRGQRAADPGRGKRAVP
mmetsp:Transcript_45529/g.136067  ORF Transcript_45529/g.136067 Transcript_45529/m.136067 type:complete len:152 (+) Transcript_45529:19-474(+)